MEKYAYTPLPSRSLIDMSQLIKVSDSDSQMEKGSKTEAHSPTNSHRFTREVNMVTYSYLATPYMEY